MARSTSIRAAAPKGRAAKPSRGRQSRPSAKPAVRATPVRRRAARPLAHKAKPARTAKKRSAKRQARPIGLANPRPSARTVPLHGKARAAGRHSPAGRAEGQGVSARGNGGSAAPASRRRSFHLPAHSAASSDITKYPWENRRDYLILVAAIAASDAELHPDELKLLNAWMDKFELPTDARTEVLLVASRGVVDLAAIARRLAGTDLTWSVMLDMMSMAMADGVLMDDEILLLRGLAAVLGIDPVDFNILIEFVHSTHQAAQLSNPEPLYEHAIDSAFHLLSRRKVRLFEHTRLCVNSSEYDRQLKQRWTRFEAGTHAHA